jgi:hypothetical protein
MEVKLTAQQLNNLLIFLERVPLTGTKEAIALVEIVTTLSKVDKEGAETQ